MFAATDQEITSVVTYGGIIVTLSGVIAWVLRSALPSLLNAFREDQAQVRREFREELSLFRADLKEMHKSQQLTNERLSTSLDKLADEMASIKAMHMKV